MASTPRRTVDDLVREASTRIDRLTPDEARSELGAGAVLVDIRAGETRQREGIVPRSIHIRRTVLEWRVDVDSPWRNPHLGGDLAVRLIVLCDHGHSSVLAAATMADLGFERPADVIGGFEAWKAAGLPVAPCPATLPAVRPGSGPPD